MTLNNDLEKLIDNLPFFLQKQIKNHNSCDQLIEIVLDCSSFYKLIDHTKALN